MAQLTEIVPAADALGIAERDALIAYRDLSLYVRRLTLESDGWHVDCELRPGLTGGGPHYVIDATTGSIICKRYEQ